MDTTTVIIITGDPIPLGIRELVNTLGKVTIIEEIDFPTTDASEKYTYTSLIVKGKKVPIWLRDMLSLLGNITISEQNFTQVHGSTVPAKYIEGQRPPLYIHNQGLFHPDLFLKLVMANYTLFTDKTCSVRIENGKTHLYSVELKLYACLSTWMFLQWFQGSGAPSFKDRVHQILSINLEYITKPTQMDLREAVAHMKWREALINLGGG